MTGSIVHENTIIALGSIATVWMAFKRGKRNQTHAARSKAYTSEQYPLNHNPLKHTERHYSKSEHFKYTLFKQLSLHWWYANYRMCLTQGDFWLIWIHLTLCSNATCWFNELIWATALAYTTHTWASVFQRHFIISDDVVFTAIFWSHIKHPLQDAAGNVLMEPAKDPPPGLKIAHPDTLYIRQSKWQKRRGEASHHLFSNGNSDPQWTMRCNLPKG